MESHYRDVLILVGEDSEFYKWREKYLFQWEYNLRLR